MVEVMSIKQSDLVAFLRKLADSIEQKGVVEKSIYVDIRYGTKEGVPIDGWKTWVHTGEKSMKVFFKYKEVLSEMREERGEWNDSSIQALD